MAVKSTRIVPIYMAYPSGNATVAAIMSAAITKQVTAHVHSGLSPHPEMKRARQHIHAILDPLWKSGQRKRGEIYAKLHEALGHPYHTAELRTIEEARTVYRAVQSIQGRGKQVLVRSTNRN
jgi:hypothetical protein